MPKKRPACDQPTLFPIAPHDLLEARHPATSTPEGDTDAVQDHGPRTSERKCEVVRTTAPDPQAPSDAGNLRPATEGQPRGLDEDSGRGEAGQPTEPDRQRGSGIGSQGTGGSFTLRVASGGRGTALAGPG